MNLNTIEKPDLQHLENISLLCRGETHKIIGCALDVINEVGHGFHEKVYENSMVSAFRRSGIPYHQQKAFPVLYWGEQVGQFIPDLIAFDSVIVDTKVIDRITDIERGQMLNYLRITKLRVGLVINFKFPKLEWERLVL